jgi:hypothetical protein
VSLRPLIDPMVQDDKEEVRLRAAAAVLRLGAIEKAEKERKARRPAAKKAPPKKK